MKEAINTFVGSLLLLALIALVPLSLGYMASHDKAVKKGIIKVVMPGVK